MAMDDADRMILRRAWQAGTLIAGDPATGCAVVAELLAQGTAPKRINESLVYRTAIAITEDAASDANEQRTLVQGDAPLYAALVRERAAWLIVRVFGEPMATACRATGLETPEAEAALGSLEASVPEGLADRLRAWMDAANSDAELDAGWRDAAPRRRRRKLLTAGLLLVLFTCFGLMLFVMFDLLAWDDREAELQQEVMRYSNPMPEGTERPPLRLTPIEPAEPGDENIER